MKVTNIKSFDFPGYSQKIQLRSSGQKLSAVVNTLTLDSQSVPNPTFVARENGIKSRVSDQASGIKCGVQDSQYVTNLVLTVRGDDITRSRANSWSLAYFKSVILHNRAV